MTLRFTEHEFETPEGRRVALLATPVERVVVGRDRLEQLRREHPGGDIDREILEHARRRAGQDQIIVFQGRAPDGEGSWRLDPDLEEQERLELGYHLVADELPTYRRLLAAGVYALVHVDWGRRGVRAYRWGTRRLLSELEAGSVPEVEFHEPETAVNRADRWILSHLTMFYEEGLDQVIERVLARQVPLLERHIPHFRKMVERLPAHAID